MSNVSTGSLQITYRVSAFKNCGDKLRNVGDASIFGISAYLMRNDKIVSWCGSPITCEDEIFLRVEKRQQQVLERLNMLVAHLLARDGIRGGGVRNHEERERCCLPCCLLHETYQRTRDNKATKRRNAPTNSSQTGTDELYKVIGVMGPLGGR